MISSAVHTVISIRQGLMLDPEMEWISRLILDARDKSWYGDLVLSFKAGHCCLVRRNETLKPPE